MITTLILFLTTIISVGICCFAVGAAYDEEFRIKQHYTEEFRNREKDGWTL